MPTDFSKIKLKLDVPSWQSTQVIYNGALAAVSAGAGSTFAYDKRASQFNRPNIYFLSSNTQFMKYNTQTGGWLQLISPALGGTFGAGAASVFMPSAGPRGTIAAGATTTTFTLSTALPATVGVNQLVGQRIRIIGNTAGGSGLTQVRTISANTAGTTPQITVNSAFTFTPGTGAAYEILTGRAFLLGAGTVVAGSWKFFDESTTSYSGNLSTTNLPTSVGTTTPIIGLDELYTPITGPTGVAINGEEGGYYGLLTATAATATTITGQAASGDAGVLANQWRNFQIRIIEDTVTPTAVGQRRRITSHTGGPSPVYTVPTWTVTPSASARYHIENNNDIVLWTATNTATYRYDWVANTWDTTTYAALPAANAAGSVAFQAFGSQVRPGVIYKFRGGVTTTLDTLDITAATTGTWTAATNYDNIGATVFNTGAGSCYSVVDNKCILAPNNLASTPTPFFFFEPDGLSLKAYALCPQTSSTLVDGDRLAVDIFADGTDKKAFVYWLPSSNAYMLRTLFYV